VNSSNTRQVVFWRYAHEKDACRRLRARLEAGALMEQSLRSPNPLLASLNPADFATESIGYRRCVSHRRAVKGSDTDPGILSQMLDVQQSSVSVVAHTLQQAGPRKTS
jgi:hypothetical protein